MAPGGFTAYSIQENPMGAVDAFSLPEAEGWHPVLGNATHEFECISLIWPYTCGAYEMVICDGQALRAQEVVEYRKHTEQTRLINAQLVLGL